MITLSRTRSWRNNPFPFGWIDKTYCVWVRMAVGGVMARGCIELGGGRKSGGEIRVTQKIGREKKKG